MKKYKPDSLLIIEPNPLMTAPYKHIADKYEITRAATLRTAFEQLIDNPPHLIMLSTSFKEKDLLEFLSELQMNNRTHVRPLILVIDLDRELNFVPGTFWGGRLGILHSLSSQEETHAAIDRITAHDFYKDF